MKRNHQQILEISHFFIGFQRQELNMMDLPQPIDLVDVDLDIDDLND